MIEAQPTVGADARPRLRQRAAVGYTAVLALFCVGTFVQVYLAGVGAFGHHAFGPHETTGNALVVVSAVALVMSLLARAPRGAVLGTLALVFLTEVAQHALAIGGHHVKWVGGLHALDGFAIVAVGLWLLVSARRRLR